MSYFRNNDSTCAFNNEHLFKRGRSPILLLLQQGPSSFIVDKFTAIGSHVRSDRLLGVIRRTQESRDISRHAVETVKVVLAQLGHFRFQVKLQTLGLCSRDRLTCFHN